MAKVFPLIRNSIRLAWLLVFCSNFFLVFRFDHKSTEICFANAMFKHKFTMLS